MKKIFLLMASVAFIACTTAPNNEKAVDAVESAVETEVVEVEKVVTEIVEVEKAEEDNDFLKALEAEVKAEVENVKAEAKENVKAETKKALNSLFK
jgi:hypothetical protein